MHSAREGRLDPRPVHGQRELAIALESTRATVENARRHARKLIEALGARLVVEEDERLVLVGGQLGDVVAQIEARPLAKGRAGLVIRARPDQLDYLNYWPSASLRRVVAEVVESFDLFAGTTRALAKPLLIRPTEVKSFIEDVLLDPARTIPLIVLTPGRHTSIAVAEELALDLAGIANVHYFEDAELAKSFVYQVTKERGVFGGAVRIYRPGFRFDCDPLDHDLLVPSYMDRRLSSGRGLGEELARRLLPHAGDPIQRPRAEPTPPPEFPVIAKTRTIADRVLELEEHVAAVEQENEELEEEVRRLNAALRQQADRLRDRESAASRSSVRATSVPGLPWPLENPDSHEVEWSDRFQADLARVARDGSLAEEVRKKMESALRHPADYGKDMRGARKGQRACYVARNYRLVWSVERRKVRFVLIVSKEDPEYSPHGA